MFLDPICCSFLIWFGHIFSAGQYVCLQSPNSDSDMILGTFRFDYEYEIEYENDFRISNR